MSERPTWCEKANCSGWNGYECCLERGLINNWPSLKSRRRERALLKRLADKDPEEVVRRCLRVDNF